MSHRSDFIPRREPEFIIWQGSLISYIETHGDRFGINTDGPLGKSAGDMKRVMFVDLKNKQNIYMTAHNIASDIATRTPANTAAKIDAYNDFVGDLRLFIKEYITFNPLVKKADRINMGLPIYKTEHTRAPIALTFPEDEMKTPAPAIVTVAFHDAGNEHDSKPEGSNTCEAIWVVSDDVIVDWEQLVHSTFGTRSPITFTFAATERGRRFNYALRWVNTRGEKGPLGNIRSVFIP